jgi:parvulin-like peptidyl-prolyl isomerase
VIATVNGEAITQGEFYQRLQRLRAQDFITSVTPLAVRNETAGTLILSSLINERLIVQWATKTNQMPSEKDLESDLERIKRQPAVVKALADGEFTEEKLRYDIKMQRARYNIATTGAAASPAEIEAYYKTHIANYTIAERWTLAGIRVSSAEKAAKVQAELKAGKPFAAVANTYSEDPATKANGGQMNPLAANSPSLPEPIRKAVTPLKAGDISPTIKMEVETQRGKPKTPLWWIIRVVAKEPGKVIPFSEVKDQVERLAVLANAGGYTTGDKKIADFRKQSVIRITLPGYKSLLNEPMKTP